MRLFLWSDHHFSMNHHHENTATGKLVLFEGPGKDFILREFPVRSLQSGEILVKNLYTTICGSDLHTYCGLRKEPSPTVLGHEIVGEVLELGPDHNGLDLRNQPLTPGTRITWTVFAGDPQSLNAQAGMPQKSDHLFKYGHAVAQMPEVFHGGLSEYCILKPNTAILRLPESMPLGVAATINCSVSTVAGALRMAGELQGKNVLITGMGHLGITCAAMCKDAGAAWVGAADITPQRLAKAQQFGADDIFNLTEDTDLLKQQLQQLTRKGPDVAIDMSGSPVAMELGLDTLAIGGIAVWIGAVFNTRTIAVNPEQIIRRLLTIRGLHNYNYADFSYALDFMERNWQRYPFQQAVEKEFSLPQTQQAFDYAVEHKPLRVGIRL